MSAVDTKVGQHIFEMCIKGILGNKTRVLTSHQERHMKEADEVIVMHKGSVLDIGPFTELFEKGTLNTSLDLNPPTPIEESKSVGRSFLQNEDKSVFKVGMIPAENHVKACKYRRKIV